MSPVLRKWLPHRRALPSAAARLFCIPYAGGGAVAFRTWIDRLAPAIELCAVEPPGRGSRFPEPAFRGVAAYADALVPIVQELSDKPFAVFGHSLGATVAFELVQRLRRMGGPLPAAVVLSGHGLKDVPEPPIYSLPTPRFIERLKRYDGTPPGLLDDAELMDLVLPKLRAAYDAAGKHEYDLTTPLDVPILALGGIADPTVPRESLEAWAGQTSGPFALRMFPGSHFYLRGEEPRVIDAVREFVEKSLRGTRRAGSW
jgi:medium-chain acyl-[acyl-carrier-protein] hydrolase